MFYQLKASSRVVSIEIDTSTLWLAIWIVDSRGKGRCKLFVERLR